MTNKRLPGRDTGFLSPTSRVRLLPDALTREIQMGDVLTFDEEMRHGASDLNELAKACKSGEVKGVAYVCIDKGGSVHTNAFYVDIGQLAMMGAVQVLVGEAGQMDEVDNSE